MRKIHLFLILIFVFSAVFIIIAKAEEKEEVPPGMEIIEIGNVRHIVPKGTKIRKDGGVITLEGHNEYMARRFSDIEERLAEVEAKEERLREEVEQLKKVLDEIQKAD